MIVALLVCSTLTTFLCARPSFPASRTESEDVEVAPGRFVTLNRQDWLADDPKNPGIDEWTEFTVRWDNADVHWEGPDIPIVLREFEGRLFLVVFVRGDLKQPKPDPQKFFRQDGTKMVPIPAKEFPPAIATQNMWVGSNLKPLLELDTGDDEFCRSPMAALWYELLKAEAPPRTHVAKNVLDEFKEKFKPVKLTQIKRASSTTQSATTRP
jgi:hypothetical protein